MKNLDLLSKRILVAAVSLTMVICSASLLISSINKASAAPAVRERALSVAGTDEYCFGISGENAYWLEFANGAWSFNKKPLADFK